MTAEQQKLVGRYQKLVELRRECEKHAEKLLDALKPSPDEIDKLQVRTEPLASDFVLQLWSLRDEGSQPAVAPVFPPNDQNGDDWEDD